MYARPDVDLWPASRDARRYAGPLPVVAHPPCQRWGWWARQFGGALLGQDDGCFRAALDAVARWGGVIEHPASSSAWTAYGLTRPGGWGWTRGPVTETSAVWSCAVDQGHYGHPAPKRTWLYLVTRTWLGSPPPELTWSPAAVTGRVNAIPTQVGRERTPLPFAELLIALARGELVTGPGQVTGDPLDRCRVCGDPVTSPRRGPPRELCSARCRQRASRQARGVTRARTSPDLAAELKTRAEGS